MSDELKRYRVTLTFEVMAEDAGNAAVEALDALNVLADEGPDDEAVLTTLGPYELTAVEIGATASVRRER